MKTNLSHQHNAAVSAVFAGVGSVVLGLVGCGPVETVPGPNQAATEVSECVVDHAEFFVRADVEFSAADGSEVFLSMKPANMDEPSRTFRLCAVGADTEFARYHSRGSRAGVGTLSEKTIVPGPGCELVVSRRRGALRVYVNARSVVTLPETTGPVTLQLQSDTIHPWRAQKIAAHALTDEFSRIQLLEGDVWRSLSGTWKTRWDAGKKAVPNPFVCEATAGSKPGLLVSGHPFWDDYRLAVSCRAVETTEMGLVFGIGPNDRRLCLAVKGFPDTPALVLSAHCAGQTEELARKQLSLLPGNWYRLTVTVSPGNPIRAGIDGVELLVCDPGRGTFGGIGLTLTNGCGLFDDVALLSLTTNVDAANEPMPELRAVSEAYVDKVRYPKDNRDDYLDRWAKDSDAWLPRTLVHNDRTLTGYDFHLPMLGDFEMELPEYDGTTVVRVCTLFGQGVATTTAAPGSRRYQRRNKFLLLDSRIVGVSLPRTPLVVGCYVESDAGPGPAARPVMRSATVRQDFFDDAPVGWVKVSGTWENTSRWQCKGEWGFFGGYGYDTVAQFCKTRFEGNQVHEYYFGMKDLFARQFERRRYGKRDNETPPSGDCSAAEEGTLYTNTIATGALAEEGEDAVKL